MKKLITFLALGVLVSGTSFAQTASQRAKNEINKTEQGRKGKGDFSRGNAQRTRLTPEQRATKRTEKLTRLLDLNKSQEKKLQDLNLRQAQQMESLRNQNATGSERNGQAREQKQQLQATWKKKFQSIVSKEQYARYEADRKQAKATRITRKGKDGAKNTRAKSQQNS